MPPPSGSGRGSSTFHRTRGGTRSRILVDMKTCAGGASRLRVLLLARSKALVRAHLSPRRAVLRNTRTSIEARVGWRHKARVCRHECRAQTGGRDAMTLELF